ncbi:hypothetical protein EW146_g7033 [Bondarzewia mesenterica]|uniref:Tafazzin family protein n=1 Tax=Bondarzewia mesenterica TaxID=1095465 RepID=A0A4S4LNS4_9AGAM|nr:hypothetical protein EW146_g7033 [Bondarzewia mesenterica]
MTVTGLPTLLEALKNDERSRGRGVVTGASDIMFTNPCVNQTLSCVPFYPNTTSRPASIFSAFFRNGQVLEIFRGIGIHQPAIDTAIQKLSNGDWIHLFGEGKVCQPHTFEEVNGVAKLRRFKWGVGRILMETPRPPIIIPMWLTGFEKLMPEGRTFPYNFIPRIGTKLSVTFGEPISPEDITSALRRTAEAQPALHLESRPLVSDGGASWLAQKGGMLSSTTPKPGSDVDEESDRLTRVEVTAVIQRAVEALGRRVSGDLLGKQPS